MSTHFDLVVIGTGSGNTIVTEEFSDRRVAFVERGVFGGTCLNRGCVPSKMYVFPADLAYAAENAGRLGVDARVERVRWRDIRDRVFGRIDPISADGRAWRAERNEHTTLYEGEARFTAERTLDVTSADETVETITGDQVVIAAGSRPVVPEVEGLDDVPFHTSDTVLRIDEIPSRLLILGGGVVCSEAAHVFSSLGADVTVVNRSPGLLMKEDTDVCERFTSLAAKRWDLRLETQALKFEKYDDGIRALLSDGSTVETDLVLVATGRRPNSDGLDLDRAGVEVDDAGLVVVDEHQRTTADGVWALGDICTTHQLKHVANHHAKVIRHNLLHPDALVAAERTVIPQAIFSDPQVARVGLTEQKAREQGVRYVTARQEYADTAYGWAMENTTGFAKLLADPDGGKILGAHIIGPQASNLIQPLVHAMAFGQSAHDVANRQLWIHPALMEVTENLLLQVR